MKHIIVVLILLILLAPCVDAKTIYYESNAASDTFEIQKPVTINPSDIWLPDDWNPMITLTNRANNPIDATVGTNISLVFFVNQTEVRRHELGVSPIYTDHNIPAESEQSWNLPYNYGIDNAMEHWQHWCDNAYRSIKVLLHLEVTKP